MAVLILISVFAGGGLLSLVVSGLARYWYIESPYGLTFVQRKRKEQERSLTVLPGVFLMTSGLFILLSHAPQLFAPPLHDVTTDPNDPPKFALAISAHKQGLDSVDFPRANGQMIQRAYPDLRPLLTALPPTEAYERGLQVATELRWVVTWHSSSTSSNLQFDATTRSPVLAHDITDIVVRVRPVSGAPVAVQERLASYEGGSFIDVRSRSRDRSMGDFGLNAEEIRRFVDHEIWQAGHLAARQAERSHAPFVEEVANLSVNGALAAPAALAPALGAGALAAEAVERQWQRTQQSQR